jgi:hypothetical protein
MLVDQLPGWTWDSVWTWWRRNSLSLPGVESRVFSQSGKQFCSGPRRSGSSSMNHPRICNIVIVWADLRHFWAQYQPKFGSLPTPSSALTLWTRQCKNLHTKYVCHKICNVHVICGASFSCVLNPPLFAVCDRGQRLIFQCVTCSCRELKDIQSKYLRLIGNYPRRTLTSHLHDTLNIEPISIIIHRLTAKLFLLTAPYTPTPWPNKSGINALADCARNININHGSTFCCI